jgi:hypothetical protein
VGEQRLIAFQYAANIWGASLQSTVEIRVSAQFTALSCTATSGVLGSAGATQSRANFTNAEFANTWYPVALANSRSGADALPGQPHITANFNSNLGNAGCLEGSGWYYGLDTNQPANLVNLVAVVLHELAHGLGFSTGPTSVTTGMHASGFPNIYERRLFDITANKSWPEMTDAERVSSAVNTGNVVWTGQQVLSAAPNVLSGTPQLTTSPANTTFAVGTAAFGVQLSASQTAGQVAVAVDGTAPISDGCEPITNGASLNGKIAIVDRGLCTFKSKVKRVQDVGGVGVVIVNNVSGAAPNMADDATITAVITIPVVSVSLDDGNIIKSQIASGTVNAFMGLNLNQLAGADAQARPKMNAPNPVEAGSSISHWDPSALPNQLMEPNINDDLSHSVQAPQDLTLSTFQDIGWTIVGTTPSVHFSPSSLDFGNSLVGYGVFQGKITVSNPDGRSRLSVFSVNISGSPAFGRSHDCTEAMQITATCTILVTFDPTSLTPQSGSLTVTTNAPGSPHVIALSGTGVTDLSLSVTRPKRPSRTGASQNQPEVFEVTLTPPAGTEITVDLTCEGAPVGVTCMVAPPRVMLQGSPVTARVTVSVAGRSQRLKSTLRTTQHTLRVRATYAGVSRTVDLPVQLTR